MLRRTRSSSQAGRALVHMRWKPGLRRLLLWRRCQTLSTWTRATSHDATKEITRAVTNSGRLRLLMMVRGGAVRLSTTSHLKLLSQLIYAGFVAEVCQKAK